MMKKINLWGLTTLTTIGLVAALTANADDIKGRQLMIKNHTTIVSEPELMAVADKSKHICSHAIEGTLLHPTGKVSSQGYLQFKQVQIIDGNCKGKIGWVNSEHTKLE